MDSEQVKVYTLYFRGNPIAVVSGDSWERHWNLVYCYNPELWKEYLKEQWTPEMRVPEGL